MNPIDRRSFLGVAGGAGALPLLTAAAAGQEADGASAATATALLPYQEDSRARRMKWWHDAKFGMFIHYGLYSIIGHQEWVMESEGIAIPDYEKLAGRFMPKPGAAREWARLAKRAGQRYMVLTTKHHEGFCLWDTATTDYNAAKQGAKRDIVREFVAAARAEGLGVGLYFSLMDWHHPDGARCKDDAAARERFVAYTHAQIRELLSNYGKIDILWYDVDWPLTPEQWRADAMNRMVFDLQPDIIVNNRNGLTGDFATPEHRITASERAWESCMTMNYGWGYQRSDQEWKPARKLVNELTLCVQQGGNYLLNIGPEADGSVPRASVDTLEQVGAWLRTNGAAIYDCDGRAAGAFGNYTNFTKAKDKLYVHVYFWPSGSPAAQVLDALKPETVVAVGGVRTKILSARLLKTGESVAFTQDAIALRLTGLPDEAPDDPTTVIELTCAGTPYVRHHLIRPEWPRYGVNIGGARSS
ncbi:alpha-L-fucosidase [Sphingomonas sp.]|jgi:alpha-L-fucosidase|uniref:alpha-L-fucosidase n=1 Tax=Sphingomonas sp. TaxID=28214 RepID=UPI002E1026E7|nr:alpha-L-fucosidase [Sphingomonas sp.]